MVRHWSGGLGAATAAVALGVAVGPWGLAAGLGIALAWLALPAAYAFAVGQVLAIAALSADAGVAAAVAAELGLLAVLAGPLAATDDPVPALGRFAAATLATGAVGWGVLRAGRPLWLAGVAVALVAATAAYGIHRYERVRLGLAGEGA